MTIIKFFDNLFFFTYRFYASFKSEKNPISAAATVVSGIQALNLLTVVFVIELLSQKTKSFQYWLAVGVSVFFQVTNYIRYQYKENISTEIIKAGREKHDNPEKQSIAVFYFLYFALSIIICFLTAIYLSNKDF